MGGLSWRLCGQLGPLPRQQANGVGVTNAQLRSRVSRRTELPDDQYVSADWPCTTARIVVAFMKVFERSSMGDAVPDVDSCPSMPLVMGSPFFPQRTLAPMPLESAWATSPSEPLDTIVPVAIMSATVVMTPSARPLPSGHMFRSTSAVWSSVIVRGPADAGTEAWSVARSVM